jgi:hypothetical protein
VVCGMTDPRLGSRFAIIPSLRQQLHTRFTVPLRARRVLDRVLALGDRSAVVRLGPTLLRIVDRPHTRLCALRLRENDESSDISASSTLGQFDPLEPVTDSGMVSIQPGVSLVAQTGSERFRLPTASGPRSRRGKATESSIPDRQGGCNRAGQSDQDLDLQWRLCTH